MNTMFGNLAPTEGMEEAQDRIGGFKIFNAGVYTGKIKLAYAGKSTSSDARSVTIVLETPTGDYSETFWVTNKTGVENFYLGKEDKKKYPLPGFTVINDICLVTTNTPLDKQPGEEKVINLYDYDAKKEVPTGVPMLVDLLGKEVTFGIQKHLENKAEKNSAGIYEDTAETREKNVVDKIFHHPSNLTVVEATKGIQKATFYGAWVEKNTDQVQDRRSIKDGAGGTAQGGRTGRPGGAPPKSDGAKATTSLFGAG